MKSKTGSLGQRMYLLRLLVKRNIKINITARL